MSKVREGEIERGRERINESERMCVREKVRMNE